MEKQSNNYATLTPGQAAKYLEIVNSGNMDDMFDWASELGWEKAKDEYIH
jgi:hypothetical protein